MVTGALLAKNVKEIILYTVIALIFLNESNAPINSIMIPENTMNLVENYFEFEDHGDIKVKAKRQNISIYC